MTDLATDREVPTLVLRPTNGWRAVNLRELWRARDLLVTFARRDITLRYRQTLLGVVWVVLQPLLAAGIFSFVFGQVADLPSEGAPYVVFAYAGLLGWNLFNSTVNKAGLSLVSNAGMVRKIYFPRLALPLSTQLTGLVDFMVALAAMSLLMVLNDSYPGWSGLSLPLWLALAMCFSMGVGMCATALAASYRDVVQVLPVAMQMLLYISPVAYSVEAIPENLQTVYSLNPLVGMLEGFRWALVPGADLRLWTAVYSAAWALVVLVAGAVVFSRMERNVADVV